MWHSPRYGGSGMFGSAKRDYTAIGPSVLAARLQQVTAPGCILVSAAVADYLEEDELLNAVHLNSRVSMKF